MIDNNKDRNGNRDGNNEEKETPIVEIKKEISRKRKPNDEDQYRVVINKEVNEVLEILVKRANEGFDGGEIAKSDVANAILLDSEKSFGDAEIKTLRNLHFDDKKMLRSILRQAGDDVDLPEHLKKALRDHYGISESSKKRPLKTNSTVLKT